jgi:hypothetical protein
MKKTIMLVVMLTLVAFVSGAIAAAPGPAASATTKPAAAAAATTAPVKLEKFGGEIKSVDAVAKSLVVVKGKVEKTKVEKTFVVTADTKITKGKEALKFEDLKAGMNVGIEYKKEMDKLIAVTIKVPVPKAAPKK